LLNEVGSLFGILKYVRNIVVKMLTFAISSPDEFLFIMFWHLLQFAITPWRTWSYPWSIDAEQ